MEGKIVFISGSTSGIGKATALGLAKMGATILLHGRNEALCRAVQAEVNQITGRNECRYYLADLTSQQQIRKMSEAIHRDIDHLDVLINNAGGVFDRFEQSEDGIEKTIALNHFSCFLLSGLLLDLLKKADNARIVNVSSRSNFHGSMDLASFTEKRGYNIIKAYGQSKLANVLFTKALARRLQETGMTVNCLHPGVVQTDIGKKDTGWLSSFAWGLMAKIRGISTDEGAKNSIYLASSPDVANVSGEYFDECRAVPPKKDALSVELQEQLWQRSLELCKVEY